MTMSFRELLKRDPARPAGTLEDWARMRDWLDGLGSGFALDEKTKRAAETLFVAANLIHSLLELAVATGAHDEKGAFDPKAGPRFTLHKGGKE